MHHAQVVMAIMKRTGCGNTVSTLGPKVPGSGRVLSQARYLLPAPLQVTDNTTKVISMMVKDSVYRAAVNDEVIMKYAHKLTLKHIADQNKHEYVRAKIRELGRLLNVVKADFQSIADATDPCVFRMCCKV